MAVIRLVFDIDSDVHPELHAQLSKIVSPAARGERFRQLAATGLVWERVRLEHPLAGDEVAVSAHQVKADVLAIAKTERPATKPRKPSRTHSNFVDLAIDVAAAARQSPVDPLALREFEDELEHAVRELPELFDKVELSEIPQSIVITGRQHAELAAAEARLAAEPTLRVSPQAAAAPMAVPVVVRQAHPAPNAHRAEEHPLTAADNLDDSSPVVTSPMQSPTRSRLQRMKDRGLFKNE